MYIENSNSNSGSQFNVDGTLKLRQNQMVSNSGFNNLYAVKNYKENIF